jgi:Mn2+/Fe2+ NRAMP family transporter
MSGIEVFVAELAFSVIVSIIIIVKLQRLMRRLGTEVCENGSGSTDFWISYTQLMVFIAPLLLVSWLSHAGSTYSAVEQLKSSLCVVLVGHFVGLALVGRAVWKSIVRGTPPAAAFTPSLEKS